MNAILEKKAALAEDTILRAIAPAMKKRQAVRRKADRGWLLGHFYRRTRTQRLMRVMYTSSPSAKRSVSWGL